jgi:hypothetical protein
MEFEVGAITGQSYLVYSRRYVKLTIESERIRLEGLFRTFYFDKSRITRLSDYTQYWWIFSDGIRIEHNDYNYPPFIVIWASDVSDIKSSLIDNGYCFS